jgi:hypothetical protein
MLIERWRQEYNTVRPHSSLGYKSPAEHQALIQDGRETDLQRVQPPGGLVGEKVQKTRFSHSIWSK